MWRRQLPVHSPVGVSGLGAALAAALGAPLARRGAGHRLLEARLGEAAGARGVTLTDSGTSALVLALRAAVGEGGTVALPGYACVDLAAAAVRARVRVRLYDIDPGTLGPDLGSLARVLAHGAGAVVVAHLYGFPADIVAVTELAGMHGVRVIEDAAQGAGGTLHGAPLGALGELSVSSFGRGKGITGGGGGALLAIAPDLAERIESVAHRRRPRAGWRDLAVATAQWMLGRPALYGIPSAIPGLRLGEMVYHPAPEPGAMSAAAAALVRAALPLAARELAVRRRNAAVLARAAEDADDLESIRPIPRGDPGFLRFPVRDLGHRRIAPARGIVRAYPRTLLEQTELRPCLDPQQMALPGAAELARTLVTLPVHGLVSRDDLDAFRAWMRSPGTRRPQRATRRPEPADAWSVS
jgi:dTDP-4-amino-4,6-dideoxygalactose transaminase